MSLLRRVRAYFAADLRRSQRVAVGIGAGGLAGALAGVMTLGIVGCYAYDASHPTTSTTTTTTTVPSTETIFVNAYNTGYTYQDNTPRNSDTICCPSVHQTAGGTGTYADPITVAVDYSGSSGQTMQFATGTRFYLPNLRAYLIAEDTTGEYQSANTAQHVDPTLGGSNPHIDVWIDGRTETGAQSDQCAQDITNTGRKLIVNPHTNYAVVVGTIAVNGQCRQNFGNTVVTV